MKHSISCEILNENILEEMGLAAPILKQQVAQFNLKILHWPVKKTKIGLEEILLISSTIIDKISTMSLKNRYPHPIQGS